MKITLPLSYTEHDIVQACVLRKRWAQKLIYEQYYSAMLGVCLRYASNQEDALDILHDGFIKVFKNIHRYEQGTSLNAWIRRLMINTSIDYYRKLIKRRTENIDTVLDLKGKDVDAVSRCSEKEILGAVQSLTPAYRAVFNLYVLEGYSHKEIAVFLNISESTSRSNLVKARQKLKDFVEKNY